MTVSVRIAAVLVFAASVDAAAESPTMTLDKIAHGYVELALAVGEHDSNYVDAYYGPEELRAKVKSDKADLATLARRAGELVAAAKALPRTADGPDSDLLALRHDYLNSSSRAWLRGSSCCAAGR